MFMVMHLSTKLNFERVCCYKMVALLRVNSRPWLGAQKAKDRIKKDQLDGKLCYFEGR